MLLSVLLGLLLGFLIGRYFMFLPNYHGPDSKDIVNSVFQTADGQYWKFVPEITVCPLDTTIMGLRSESKSED